MKHHSSHGGFAQIQPDTSVWEWAPMNIWKKSDNRMVRYHIFSIDVFISMNLCGSLNNGQFVKSVWIICRSNFSFTSFSHPFIHPHNTSHHNASPMHHLLITLHLDASPIHLTASQHIIPAITHSSHCISAYHTMHHTMHHTSKTSLTTNHWHITRLMHHSVDAL